MRFPPTTNATLSRVQAGAGAEDYDDTPAAGADKWTGSQGVLIVGEQASQDSGGDSSIIASRTVIVDNALAVTWERGDLLTFTYRGQGETATVRDVKQTFAQGLPGVVRLVLRDG